MYRYGPSGFLGDDPADAGGVDYGALRGVRVPFVEELDGCLGFHVLVLFEYPVPEFVGWLVGLDAWVDGIRVRDGRDYLLLDQAAPPSPIVRADDACKAGLFLADQQAWSAQ